MPVWRKKNPFVDRSVKKKKETILIEIPKDAEVGEYVNGFEVIKKVKRFGKYYVKVKNK